MTSAAISIPHRKPGTRESLSSSPGPVADRVDVSIIIVTWNSAKWIGRCLEAIPSGCGDVSFEVRVHDNASEDSTLGLVSETNCEDILVQYSPQNLGFAGGVNSALAGARGRYVLCMNPDCEPAPGSIGTLVEYLDRHTEVAGAAPLLLDQDGVPQREFQLRRLPTLGSLAADILLLHELVPSNPISSRYHCRDLDITRSQAVEQPAGAALMLRRETVESVGPFDESFMPAWFEDVDYCQRLRTHGAQLDLVPSSKMTHRGGASLDHVPFVEFLAIWYRNLFRYGRKWFTPGKVEALRWMVIGGMILRAAAVLVGLARSGEGRIESIRGYLAIAREAFLEWNRQSPSS